MFKKKVRAITRLKGKIIEVCVVDNNKIIPMFKMWAKCVWSQTGLCNYYITNDYREFLTRTEAKEVALKEYEAKK